MELRDLRFFVAVGEELHFARAAERLHIVPAAVSQHIRALEEELGLTLFERTSRKVALTPAGAQLLEPARSVLAEAESLGGLARSLATGAAGQVTIGFSPNLGEFATRAILAIRDAHPELDIVGRSMWSMAAMTAVAEGEVTAAVVRGPASAPGLAASKLGGTSTTGSQWPPTMSWPPTSPSPCRHSLARPVLVPERELAPAVHDAALQFFADHDVVPLWRYHQLQDFEPIMRLVAAGVGATFVHSHLESSAYPGVVALALAEPGPRMDVQLVWRAADESTVARTLRRVELRYE